MEPIELEKFLWYTLVYCIRLTVTRYLLCLFCDVPRNKYTIQCQVCCHNGDYSSDAFSSVRSYCNGLLYVFPTHNIVNFLINFTYFTATYLSKAQYSLFVLKVLLNPNQSIFCEICNIYGTKWHSNCCGVIFMMHTECMCSCARCTMPMLTSGLRWHSLPSQPVASLTLSSITLTRRSSRCSVMDWQKATIWHSCFCLVDTCSVMTATIIGCREWHCVATAHGKWRTRFLCRLVESSTTLLLLLSCQRLIHDSLIEHILWLVRLDWTTRFILTGYLPGINTPTIYWKMLVQSRADLSVYLHDQWAGWPHVYIVYFSFFCTIWARIGPMFLWGLLARSSIICTKRSLVNLCN